MVIKIQQIFRVVNETREYGCGVIQITASDMGDKLYTDVE